MTKKPLISPQLIADCLRLHYGIAPISVTSLQGGADRDASVYKAETESDGSCFLKLKRGDQEDKSLALQALLQAAGIQQILSPIKTTEGRLSQVMEGYTLTVYPFVEGENSFCHKLTEDQWVALGRALRQLHEFSVPLSHQHLIRKESYSPKWREIVRSLWDRDEDKLSCDETGLKLQEFMSEHKELLHHLVDRAESLSQRVRGLSPEHVFCHSDIHGGNVLIGQNGSIFIVDWDDPVMAPKERDLMFIGGGVANVWNSPHEEELFYKGYGKVEINREILAYYRYERIVEDIAEYGQILLLSSEGGKERIAQFEQFKSMFESKGVVDIALKTDVEDRDRLHKQLMALYEDTGDDA